MRIELEEKEWPHERKRILIHEPTKAIKCYLELSSIQPRQGGWDWLEAVAQNGESSILTFSNYNAAASVFRKLLFVASDKMTVTRAQEIAERYCQLYEGWKELAILLEG